MISHILPNPYTIRNLIPPNPSYCINIYDGLHIIPLFVASSSKLYESSYLRMSDGTYSINYVFKGDVLFIGLNIVFEARN
ncbi:hypothetical protein BH23THE1_BH23THE1_30020 [soil metagenome]